MKKIVITIIAIVLVLLVVLSFTKDMLANKLVSAGVRSITGLKLSMESLDVAIIKSFIGIKELKLFNPSGFPDELMVDIPEIYIDYDLGALIKKNVHLEEVRLNLKEFVVIKNEKGEVNIKSVKAVQAERQEAAPVEEKEEEEKIEEKAKKPEFQIDVLDLKIGKVIYKDYSKGTPPEIKEYDVNIDERYENITDPYTFAKLIIVKTLMNTPVASLANFDLGPLKEGVTEKLKEAIKLETVTPGKAVEVGKEIEIKGKGPAKGTAEKTTDKFKKILPFGK